MKSSVVYEVEFPEGITGKLERNVLTVKGPLGECRKDFAKVKTQIVCDGKKVITKPFGKRKFDLTVSNTAKSIVKNMVKGVTKGFTYKLKIVFAHFPISVKVKDDKVLIENFIGERAPRIAKIFGATKVRTEGDDVIVTGVSLEDVGQTAANIEQCTKIKNKDQRVFLDGVFVFEKQKD